MSPGALQDPVEIEEAIDQHQQCGDCQRYEDSYARSMEDEHESPSGELLLCSVATRARL
jgi:hypothetical protein